MTADIKIYINFLAHFFLTYVARAQTELVRDRENSAAAYNTDMHAVLDAMAEWSTKSKSASGISRIYG